MTTKILASPASQFQPQFYDPDQALARAPGMSRDKYLMRTKNRKTNSHSPEQYFTLWMRRLENETLSMRRLTEMYVTMHRRFRGVTISDQFGYFGTRPDTDGYWIDYDPEQDGEVHPINIVRPDIRANVSALLQVNVGVDVEPPNQDAKNRDRAEKIQALVDYFERHTWAESHRTLIFDGIQKEGVNLVENYQEAQTGREQTLYEPVEINSLVAKFQCEACGETGTKEIAEEEAEVYNQPQVACPFCGEAATSIVEGVKNYGLKEVPHSTTDIKHRIWSGFNFVIDRRGARRDGIKSAKYLQIMDLVDRAELEADYPQFAFEGPFEWSWQLKCQHALAQADWSILHLYWSPTEESTEWDLFEKRRIFLHESAYRNYVSPSDWEFVDGNGKVKLTIKRGQTLSEAIEATYGKKFEAICLVFVNDRLIDIEDPEMDDPNFRNRFSDVHFLRDSGSYHSVPNWDSKQIQDDITLFNTLKTETAARNSVKPVWFNSEVFDISDFGREYIPSKDGALDPDTGNIQNQVFQPPIAKAADDINEHLQFLLGIRREVSGIQPAMLGEAQPGQPYAAQRQQLEQSFGLLTACSKSYAQMKVESTKQKIRMAFNTWTLEQFQGIASRNGETWTEEDVIDLVATDLDRDVIIDYVPGTEVPQGNLTRELKFWNGVREALPLIQAAMQSGTLDPDTFRQLLKRIDEFADFDFDLSGKETADAVAQKRFSALSEACEKYREVSSREIEQMKQEIVAAQPMIDPATGEAAIDELGQPAIQTITVFDTIAEQIHFAADLFFSPFEDAESQISFFTVEIMREMAKPKPNYMLVEIMQLIVGDFMSQQAEAQAAAAANDPALQQAEADRKAKGEGEEAKRAHDKEMAGMKHEQEVEKMAIGEASKENEREYGRETAARDASFS